MADPITPNTPNVDGQVVTIFADVTSTGATTEETIDLPSYAPKIDLRIGHPVLSMAFFDTETDATGSEVFSPDGEMARGTSGDSAGEWQVHDKDTVKAYITADEDGIMAITYIAFGSQQA